jgi:hypothetical protein
MSWIKPNFLWMMYRCGWATKVDQERVLALRLRRTFFEQLLRDAVASTYYPPSWESRHAWEEAVRGSDVRLQWDPDHDPAGSPVERRAIQLGLRGATLATFATTAILAVEDITELVAGERPNASHPFDRLRTPSERVFQPNDGLAAVNLGLDATE